MALPMLNVAHRISNAIDSVSLSPEDAWCIAAMRREHAPSLSLAWCAPSFHRALDGSLPPLHHVERTSPFSARAAVGPGFQGSRVQSQVPRMVGLSWGR